MGTDRDPVDNRIADLLADAGTDGVYTWQPLRAEDQVGRPMLLVPSENTIIEGSTGFVAIVHGDRTRRLMLTSVILGWLKLQDKADEGK